MNWQSFISLIQTQSDSTFFIRSTQQSNLIGETTCALLNTDGGTLVIGYDKVNVHLTGYEETDQWIDQFIDRHFKTSTITSTFLFRSNKKICLLDIEKSEFTHNFKTIFYKIHENKIIEFQPTTPTFTLPPNPSKNEFITPNLSQPTLPTHTPAPTESASSSQTYPPIQSTSAKPSSEPISSVDVSAESPYAPPTNAINEDQPLPTTQKKSTIPATFEIKNDITNGEKELNARQLNALEFILKQGSIKNKQYRKLFNVSHKTAHIELVELVQKNHVIIVGSGRSTCYRLPQSNQSKTPLSQLESVIPQTLLESYLSTHQHITESSYADEFNMDLAQAINELQHYCDEGVLEKTLINNETCYIKAKQLSFI